VVLYQLSSTGHPTVRLHAWALRRTSFRKPSPPSMAKCACSESGERSLPLEFLPKIRAVRNVRGRSRYLGRDPENSQRVLLVDQPRDGWIDVETLEVAAPAIH